MQSYPLGPDSWPIWLRSMLPYSDRFRNGASAHDFFYSLGADENDRERADWIFFEECLDGCDTEFQELFAIIYFKLVRSCGWAFFVYRETCGKLPKR